MDSRIRATLPSIWFYGAAAISSVVVIETFFSYHLTDEFGILRYFNKLSLASERTIGTWWSGILLILISIHAFDGYVRWRQHRPQVATGWALIAILLLLLSADELSSAHERVEDIGGLLGIGPWLALLPFATIIGLMLAYALALLWSHTDERSSVWLILLSFALFGLVVLQEAMHDEEGWRSATQMAIEEGVEEGTEILAMMVLLSVTMRNTFEPRRRQGAGVASAFEALRLLRFPFMVIGLVLTPILAYVSATLTDNAGRPADWLAALAFFAAALLPVRRFVQGDGRTGWRAWGMSALCLLASVTVIAIVPTDAISIASTEINVRMLILCVAVLSICVTWATIITRGAEPTISPVWIITAGMLAIVGLSQTNLLAIYAVPQLMGLLVYYVNSGYETAVIRPHPSGRRLRRRDLPG